MENEKKKLLLVAISVGIFLVIAIGAAILVITPKTPAASASNHSGSGSVAVAPAPDFSSDNQAPVYTGNSRPVSMDAVDLVRAPGDVPGLQSLPQGTSLQSTDVYVNGSARSAGESRTPAAGSGTVISVPKPSSAAVPDAAPAGRAVAAARPAAKSTQTSPVSNPASAKPAAQAQPRPAAQPKVYDDYWVQTGAFATVTKAEGVKDTLASKGITSIIENREVDGKVLFRVRVGPYTSKNEADYWLSLIKSIGGFEDSQVRQTRR